MTPITEQDRAAFEVTAIGKNLALPHQVKQRNADGRYLYQALESAWWGFQAALAYARERQAEREKRLVKWLLSKDVWKCSLTDKEARELIEAYDAQEQGR